MQMQWGQERQQGKGTCGRRSALATVQKNVAASSPVKTAANHSAHPHSHFFALSSFALTSSAALRMIVSLPWLIACAAISFSRAEACDEVLFCGEAR